VLRVRRASLFAGQFVPLVLHEQPVIADEEAANALPLPKELDVLLA